MFEVIEARREGAPITAAFIGGSGSGKTYSALLFARGLVGKNGKIVVIDTEGGRANIYADDPRVAPFHRIDMIEPYTSERFREAFRIAVQAEANAVIIDTISHEHEGFLEYAEQEERRLSGKQGASRNKWIKPKAFRKRFYSAISSSHVHVIATIRLNRIVNMDTKPATEIMKPECDKDFPYRLDLSVEINPDHTTTIIKVPEPLKPMVEGGVMIDVRHGQALASEILRHDAPNNAKIKAVIVNLEQAAESGPDTLKHAWEAAWRNAGPAGNIREITPDRAELQRHLPRLKSIAAEADEREKLEAGDFGSMPNESRQDDADE